jgi:hypothetical protein
MVIMPQSDMRNPTEQFGHQERMKSNHYYEVEWKSKWWWREVGAGSCGQSEGWLPLLIVYIPRLATTPATHH